VKLLDLQSQYAARSTDYEAALLRVARSGQFLDGSEGAALESQLEAYLGRATHAICCASGSDALVLALKASGVGAGDEVIVPAFTFAATAEAVVHVGARPVFADVEMDGLVSRATLEPCLSGSTKAVVMVSLFGQIPALETIGPWLESLGIVWIEDGAQSFGARRNGRLSTTFGLATTSFFPGKPLGAWGKGGAVFSANAEMALRLRALRNHGQVERGLHEEVGWNSRLDEMQAAILQIKLEEFPKELQERRQRAQLYCQALPDGVKLLRQNPENESSWSQLPVRVPHRDAVREHLRRQDIPTGIHYAIPLHHQPAFAAWRPEQALPVSELLAAEILSLPLHPWLSSEDVQKVCVELGRG
jgi:UDP-2-acetamido-2-deoxy-ribo-hexuluronate aminotransferase